MKIRNSSFWNLKNVKHLISLGSRFWIAPSVGKSIFEKPTFQTKTLVLAFGQHLRWENPFLKTRFFKNYLICVINGTKYGTIYVPYMVPYMVPNMYPYTLHGPGPRTRGRCRRVGWGAAAPHPTIWYHLWYHIWYHLWYHIWYNLRYCIKYQNNNKNHA